MNFWLLKKPLAFITRMMFENEPYYRFINAHRQNHFQQFCNNAHTWSDHIETVLFGTKVWVDSWSCLPSFSKQISEFLLLTVGKAESTAQAIPKVQRVPLHSPPKHPGHVLHPPTLGFLCRRQSQARWEKYLYLESLCKCGTQKQ